MSVTTKKFTPQEASDEYIRLEYQHRKLHEELQKTSDYKKARSLREKKKAIREEQNRLYPLMTHGGVIQHTQEVLGLTAKYAIYKRYKNGRKPIKGIKPISPLGKRLS